MQFEDNNIDAYIPNFGQYVHTREGFVYNEELDQYECQRGNRAILPCKGERVDGTGYHKKTYRSRVSGTVKIVSLGRNVVEKKQILRN